AVSDDDIVGTIALIDIGNKQVALRKMFVKEAFRGKQYGVASRLLEHVLDYAGQRALSQIFLGTTDKFIAAHRFYEKNGFDLIDVEELPDSFPRMKVDTRFYVRSFK
ncbi:MAG: GNAT family N-acetyltransferase, partial [Kordiimonas sp.]